METRSGSVNVVNNENVLPHAREKLWFSYTAYRKTFTNYTTFTQEFAFWVIATAADESE